MAHLPLIGGDSIQDETLDEGKHFTKDFKGLLDTSSFDENGDTTNKVISVYKADNDAPAS